MRDEVALAKARKKNYFNYPFQFQNCNSTA